MAWQSKTCPACDGCWEMLCMSSGACLLRSSNMRPQSKAARLLLRRSNTLYSNSSKFTGSLATASSLHIIRST